MMDEKVRYLKIDNDNLFQTFNLIDVLTGNYINNASITVTLKNLDGTEVVWPDGTWPLNWTYVPSSNGRYYTILPSNVPLVVNQTYHALVIVDTPAGRHVEKTIICVAKRDYVD